MTCLLLAPLMAIVACDRVPSRSVEGVPSSAAAEPAQGQRAGGGPCAGNGSELELTASRPQITLGEPAVVLVRLRNCSAGAVQTPPQIEPEYGALRILIVPPDGKPYEFATLDFRETRGQDPVVMEPGQERGAVAHLYADKRRGWALNLAGGYQVQGRIAIGGRTLESVPVAIRVMPAPAGVSSESLAALWRQLGPVLYHGRQSPVQDLNEWMLRRQPRTDYLRPIVRVAQVITRSGRQYDVKTESLGAPDCAALIPDATAIVKDVADPYFRAVAASRLRACFQRTGQPDEGRKLIRLAQSADPAMARHPAIAPLLEDSPSQSR